MFWCSMRKSFKTNTRAVAFGGVFAALALVIMCMGTLIPVATYACPILCLLLLAMVQSITDTRIAWAWYAAVSILSLLLAPDKEAAVVFLFLGNYPMVRNWIKGKRFFFLWKLIYFNTVIFFSYVLLIWLMGLHHISEEFRTLGRYGAVIMLLAGNILFFAVDRLLATRFGGKR